MIKGEGKKNYHRNTKKKNDQAKLALIRQLTVMSKHVDHMQANNKGL